MPDRPRPPPSAHSRWMRTPSIRPSRQAWSMVRPVRSTARSTPAGPKRWVHIPASQNTTSSGRAIGMARWVVRASWSRWRNLCTCPNRGPRTVVRPTPTCGRADRSRPNPQSDAALLPHSAAPAPPSNTAANSSCSRVVATARWRRTLGVTTSRSHDRRSLRRSLASTCSHSCDAVTSPYCRRSSSTRGSGSTLPPPVRPRGASRGDVTGHPTVPQNVASTPDTPPGPVLGYPPSPLRSREVPQNGSAGRFRRVRRGRGVNRGARGPGSGGEGQG